MPTRERWVLPSIKKSFHLFYLSLLLFTLYDFCHVLAITIQSDIRAKGEPAAEHVGVAGPPVVLAADLLAVLLKLHQARFSWKSDEICMMHVTTRK